MTAFTHDSDRLLHWLSAYPRRLLPAQTIRNACVRLGERRENPPERPRDVWWEVFFPLLRLGHVEYQGRGQFAVTPPVWLRSTAHGRQVLYGARDEALRKLVLELGASCEPCPEGPEVWSFTGSPNELDRVAHQTEIQVAEERGLEFLRALPSVSDAARELVCREDIHPARRPHEWEKFNGAIGDWSQANDPLNEYGLYRQVDRVGAPWVWVGGQKLRHLDIYDDLGSVLRWAVQSCFRSARYSREQRELRIPFARKLPLPLMVVRGLAIGLQGAYSEEISLASVDSTETARKLYGIAPEHAEQACRILSLQMEET